MSDAYVVKRTAKKKRKAKAFAFKLAVDGPILKLPNLQTLSLEFQQEMSKALLKAKDAQTDEERFEVGLLLTTQLLQIIQENAPEVLNELEGEELQDLFEAWFKHSGITPGKSSGSAK